MIDSLSKIQYEHLSLFHNETVNNKMFERQIPGYSNPLQTIQTFHTIWKLDFSIQIQLYESEEHNTTVLLNRNGWKTTSSPLNSIVSRICFSFFFSSLWDRWYWFWFTLSRWIGGRFDCSLNFSILCVPTLACLTIHFA